MAAGIIYKARGTKPTNVQVVSKPRKMRRKTKTLRSKASSLLRRVTLLEKTALSEKKFSENTWANFANVVTTPVFTYSPTFNIVRGTTEGTRTDDKIMLDTYHLRYVLEAGTQQNIIRVMVILDKDSSEAAPTTGALFSGFNSADTFCFYNPDYLGHRFKILYDKMHAVGFNQGTPNFYTGGVMDTIHDVKIPVKGIITTYSGNTGTVTSAATNHIYVLAWALNTNSFQYIRDRIGFLG